MEIIRFEDERWRTFSQKTEFRHATALSLITKGPVLDVGCGDGLLAVPENNRPHKGHVFWFNKRTFDEAVNKVGLTVEDVRMNTFSLFRMFGTHAPRLFPNLLALSFVARLKKGESHMSNKTK